MTVCDQPHYAHLSDRNGMSVVLVDSWEQCKDADVLLESPSAMAGVHIAEALRGSTLWSVTCRTD
jgi:hypothetical protein